MLGRNLVIKDGSGARRNYAAESALADRLRTDSSGEPREYSIAW